MKKIIPIAALVLSTIATGVNAQVVITENELNMNTGILTIKGVTDTSNTAVSLNIPQIGITPQSLQESDVAGEYIVYSGQVSSNQDNAFTFTVDFNGADEGTYDIYIGHESESEEEVFEAKKTKATYTTSSNYEMLIAALNEKAAVGKTEFDAEFDTNEGKLFLCPDIEVQNKDVVKEILFNYSKEHGFLTNDSPSNMRVYKTALVAQLIKDGRVKDAQTLLDGMYVLEEGVVATYGVAADFNTYINTDAKREYLASQFKECKTIEDFDKELTNAMILTIVKYPENVTKLQEIFEKYSKYLEADTKDAMLSDYSLISGKTYADMAACVKEFNKRVNKHTSDSSGGGGGGGSSGSSLVIPGATETGNEKIGIKFEDLNPVPWAYNAISELFERSIISGKSETRFAPNDKVTREEFAKMLVEMAGVEVNNSANVFSDVKDDAWYKGYVNTAFEKGFCNGIGKGVFGTGMEITRQDMCVMAYNVLKALNHEVTGGELTFSDAAEIAQYAKNPVAALNNAGIVNGVGNGKFNPNGNATRAEAAVIIYKVLMYIG